MTLLLAPSERISTMGSNSRIPSPKEILGDPFFYLLWRIWNALEWIWVLLGWAIAIVVVVIGVSLEPPGPDIVGLVGLGIVVAWIITWWKLIDGH